MSVTVSEIAEQAKALSAAERVALAQVLLESVQSANEPEAAAEWEAEICKRVTEIESGSALLVSSESVYAKARARLK